MHSFNLIVKFADDTTIVGLITDNEESAYREEVDTLTTWCQDNILSLNISKTKEMIVAYRRRQVEEHAPLYINGSAVEMVSCFRLLWVNISNDLTWSGSHRQGGQSGPEAPLLPEETEEVWHGFSHPHQFLQIQSSPL